MIRPRPESRRRRAGSAAAAILLLGAALAGCAPSAPVRAERAWVRPSVPGGVTAGYLTIVNDSDTPIELVGVSGDCADEIQMHESVRDSSGVSMRRVERFPVPAHGRLEFRPGANHLMVMGVRRRLAPGNIVDLTLRLADGRRLAAPARVRD